MISYELVEKLKEVGFKSEHQLDMDTGAWCVNCPWDKGRPEKGFKDMCFPTLSELIEACGENFDCLVRLGFSNSIHKKWAVNCDDLGYSGYEGDTPEEAVANLWLALNKKKND